nr:uncharacterized protein LOC101252142 isoform X2 [Solanum lycopersicum]
MFLLLYICFISSYFPAINPESSSGEIVLHPLGSPVPARPKLPAILSIDRKYPRGCHGMRKTEVNLKRLLVTAPQQQNQAKLIHYVATLRELLEQLAKERNPDGLPRISKAKVNEYAENIEYVAAKLAVPTLKESSLMMNQSIKNTKKILDSTEKAVEHSLASTWHATSRAMDMYSRSFKTTCYQWLLIFVMVALLIRVTLQPTLCVTEDIIELLSFSIFV